MRRGTFTTPAWERCGAAIACASQRRGRLAASQRKGHPVPKTARRERRRSSRSAPRTASPRGTSSDLLNNAGMLAGSRTTSAVMIPKPRRCAPSVVRLRQAGQTVVPALQRVQQRRRQASQEHGHFPGQCRRIRWAQAPVILDPSDAWQAEALKVRTKYCRIIRGHVREILVRRSARAERCTRRHWCRRRELRRAALFCRSQMAHTKKPRASTAQASPTGGHERR
jgi:hypothetical protein